MLETEKKVWKHIERRFTRFVLNFHRDTSVLFAGELGSEEEDLRHGGRVEGNSCRDTPELFSLPLIKATLWQTSRGDDKQSDGYCVKLADIMCHCCALLAVECGRTVTERRAIGAHLRSQARAASGPRGHKQKAVVIRRRRGLRKHRLRLWK